MSKTLTIDTGVKLEAAAGPMVKRALVCHTGNFDGMNGPVKVSAELLELIAAKYKSDRVSPTNENDYAPILVNHDRLVENVKGRILPDNMEVAEWKPIEGVMQMGLFADLRVDDPEAQANVESGKFAQLSISFDEETGELFEVSFVAVPAAREAIVLKKGAKHMGDTRLTQLAAKHKNLAAFVKESRKTRKAILSTLIKDQKSLMTEITELQEKSSGIALAVKKSQIKAKFTEFVRGGKMTPKELKDLDMSELATLSESAMKVVLASYSAREVSSDVVQHGQTGARSVKVDLSPESMREAIKLQREGKGSISLADKEGEENIEKDDDKKKIPQPGESDPGADNYAMGKEEWTKCLEDMAGVHQKLAEVIEKVKGMDSKAGQLAENDDKDDVKEQKMASDEADEKPKDKTEGEE